MYYTNQQLAVSSEERAAEDEREEKRRARAQGENIRQFNHFFLVILLYIYGSRSWRHSTTSIFS
jgi:hypothetical protein